MANSSRPKVKAKEKSKVKKKKARAAAETAEALARRDLSKMVLRAYENEYADQTSLWEQIERKAQGTIAIAGIMLAGGLAFASQLGASVGSLQAFLFVGLVVTLFFGIWQCVKALKVTTLDVPPKADDVRQLADDALRFPEKSQLPDLVNGLRYGLLDLWSAYNQVLAEKCEEKAVLVGRSHSAILISALLIATVTGMHLWDASSETNRGAVKGKMHNSGLSESAVTTENRAPRPETGWQETVKAADRTDWGFEPDGTNGGPGEKERQRLSAARSFRPLR